MAAGNWTELEERFTAYLSGDASATHALFFELQKLLHAYYRVRLPSLADAEDLAQVALLKIHFARDRYDRQKSLKTWVFTIASRTMIDHWRGSAGEAEPLREPETMDETPGGELDPALKAELHRDLNQALAGLKPIDRSIVYLYGVEGLSMAEIADALSISEGAAKVRAHRAYREMRKVLATLLAFGVWKWM